MLKTATPDATGSPQRWFPAGTLIQTDDGPKPIETVTTETHVAVFQESYAKPVAVSTRQSGPHSDDSVGVWFPRFTIGNATPICLPKDMQILLAEYELTEFVDTPYFTILARDLVGHWGVKVGPAPQPPSFALHFEGDTFLNIEGHAYVRLDGRDTQLEADEEGFVEVCGERILNLSGDLLCAYLECIDAQPQDNGAMSLAV